LGEGQEYGRRWVPAEVDVSIRKGWFYHANEEARTPENILNLYYQSVGRNSNLLLNIPPNRQGLFADNDVKSMIGFKKLLDQEFKNEVKPLKVTSAFNRGKEYAAQNMADNNPNTYWATKDNVTKASAEFNFGKPVELNRVLLQEYIKLGQRVKDFKVEAFVDGQWKQLTDGTTIGHKVIKKCELTKTNKVRLTVEAKACPLISNVKFYLAPTK
jgi:alpha-L-fucosidase